MTINYNTDWEELAIQTEDELEEISKEIDSLEAMSDEEFEGRESEYDELCNDRSRMLDTYDVLCDLIKIQRKYFDVKESYDALIAEYEGR